MYADYITLSNGLTVLIKEAYRTEDAINCYYLFNDIWVPTTLDVNSIVNIRSVQLDEPEVPMFDNFSEDCCYRNSCSFEETSNSYPCFGKNNNKFFTNENSSESNNEFFTNGENGENNSELFTNTENGIEDISPNLSKGLNASMPNFGTVIAPVFPKIQSYWFYTGFPTKLNVGGANGNLIDFIPIFFYATKDGNETFTLPKLPDRLGYLDQNNNFTESLFWSGPFKKGNLLFILLLDKNDPSTVGSKLANHSYWSLLTEFSNIDPGSTASKSITISSGISKEQSEEMSFSIGSRVSVEIGIEDIAKVSAELSSQLSSSFSTSVSISKQITTTDTVEFKAQPRTQRIATYQFIEQYEIDAANALKEKLANFNDKNKNYIANFAKADFQVKPFDYESRYFAKAFVLEPEM